MLQVCWVSQLSDLQVAEAYSRSWCGREHALLAVHEKLLEASSAAPKEELSHMIRAAGPLARRALLDKVPPVSPSFFEVLDAKNKMLQYSERHSGAAVTVPVGILSVWRLHVLLVGV